MKKLTRLAGGMLAVALAVVATADELTPVPEIPGVVFGPTVGEPIVDPIMHEPIVEGPIYVDSVPEPLFTRVKYVDKREMHPCAVPKIIQVNDPCACKKACDCCGPKCVFIEICVPPCGCEEVRCRRKGNRVRYDYGKYAVDVRVKKGFIVVDYQK